MQFDAVTYLHQIVFVILDKKTLIIFKWAGLESR